jgi:cation diffusion facilitator CzcD-associated flavoprotein CzcO
MADALKARSVAVVGAGASGVAALKQLRDAGLEITCLEAGGDVGGLWVYENSNGLSAAYRSLHANTVKSIMAYAGHPMPSSYPDYPHHTQVAEYLNGYVDANGLRPSIRLWTKVVRAEPTGEGGWDLSLETQLGRQDLAVDALVVATGHLWDPLYPEPAYPGAFGGIELHGREYREPTRFMGRRVLVVGMGNSATDIAVDVASLAEQTYISARHATHILPKYLFGRPLGVTTGVLARLDWRLRDVILERILRAYRGGYERYGLPTPDRGIYRSHPTVNDSILSMIAHGRIKAKPAIARLHDQAVTFADGTSERIDTIIWSTGYRTTVPFIDSAILPVSGNRVGLYKRIFPVGVPSVAFVGFVQQRGALMPIAEEQSRLIAAWLTGRYALPAETRMVKDIEAYDRGISRRYLATLRHTMEVEQGPYIAGLRAERRRGAVPA